MEKRVQYIGLKLNNRTDADILEVIGGVEERQAEIKRLMRIGMDILKNQHENANERDE